MFPSAFGQLRPISSNLLPTQLFPHHEGSWWWTRQTECWTWASSLRFAPGRNLSVSLCSCSLSLSFSSSRSPLFPLPRSLSLSLSRSSGALVLHGDTPQNRPQQLRFFRGIQERTSEDAMFRRESLVPRWCHFTRHLAKAKGEGSRKIWDGVEPGEPVQCRALRKHH